MNATIEDLRMQLDKGSYLTVIKGFDQEKRPYTLISECPRLEIDITAKQGRDLCKDLLVYFPDVIEEAKEDDDAISKAS